MNDSNQLKKGAIMSYVVILFNVVAGLLYTPWMIRKIGSGDYGLYILVTSFIAYFISDYGMWQSINKLISQYRAENKNNEISNLLGTATKLYFFLDMVILAVLTIGYFFLNDIFPKLTVEELVKFKFIYLISVCFNFFLFPLSFLRGVMVSYEFFFQEKIFNWLDKVLLIVVTVTLLFFNYGLYSLVIAYGLVPLVVNVSKIIFLYRKGVRLNFKYWSWGIVKKVFSISVWLVIIVLAELIINKLSPSFIASFSNSNEIAIFAVGFSIANYVYAFAGSINGLFLPKVSRMHVAGQQYLMFDLTIKVGRIQFLIIGYLIFGILLTGKAFIIAWLGETFVHSFYVMSLLVLPGFVIYSQPIESTNLFALDKIKYSAMVMIGASITSIILFVLLIPKYGAIGAAISICIANFLFAVIGMNIVYNQILNFDTVRFLKTLLKFFTVYLCISILYLLFKTFVIDNYIVLTDRWMQFLINAIVYTILYTILMLFVLNSYEKKMILSGMNKFFRIIKIIK
jgi:O-antigen/teichoic acid export membrane protein